MGAHFYSYRILNDYEEILFGIFQTLGSKIDFWLIWWTYLQIIYITSVTIILAI